MTWSRFDAEKCYSYEINERIIFSEVSKVSLLSFIGIPWNSNLNSLERSSCVIHALRSSVAWWSSSVSRMSSLLSRLSIFSWATSKGFSTAVTRWFRLGSICAKHRSIDLSSCNVGSACAFCTLGFLECLKVNLHDNAGDYSYERLLTAWLPNEILFYTTLYTDLNERSFHSLEYIVNWPAATIEIHYENDRLRFVIIHNSF